MNRHLLWTLAVWLGAAAGGLAADPKTKVVLIGKDRDHPYATHEYMSDCELLAKCLRQTPGVEAVVSNGWPKDPAVLKDVTALVLHTQKGGNVLFKGPQRREAEELLANGIGLTAIHWSTGADKGEVGELFLRTLGGWFDAPPAKPVVDMTKLRQVDPKHPVCRGWQEFDLRDEYYIDLKFLPEHQPVLAATVKGKDYTVGWVYERPGAKGGRSFGFVCGHFHANFGEKPFRQAVVNGILWTARRDVPAGGAPCAITAKDMELPPPADKPKKE